MLPTLILCAPQPGMLYLNGRFAGEIGADEPLIRPVNPRGAVYLDYRPFSPAFRTMARKLVFSGGEPMPASVAEAEDIDVVLWPRGATEVELTPESARGEIRFFQAAGRAFLLQSGALYMDGAPLATLPPGAQVPSYHALPGGAALLGACDGGEYLLTLDPQLRTQTGLLQARKIEIDPDGGIRTLIDRNDAAGHAVRERWQLTPEGLALLASEPGWVDGAPRAPSSAGEVARMAVEAALAGFDAEAEGYLAPALRELAPLRGIRDRCDLCVEMKYAPGEARPCVGLLRLEGENLARVRPLYYRAVGAREGYWIEELEFGD